MAETRLTAPDLRAEAEAMARPCTYLRTKGRQVAGFWRGPPAAPSPGPDYRHWLSVDARLLPPASWSGSGCVSVFTRERDIGSGAVVFEAGARLPFSGGGTPLFAEPALSLPPVDAIFKLGSPRVGAWLRSLEWHPAFGYTDNFPDPEPVRAYEEVYQRQLPLYSGGAHAVAGGWHFPWPDGDWDELVARTLLLWTFEESEPWIEAWSDGSREWVVQRIT